MNARDVILGLWAEGAVGEGTLRALWRSEDPLALWAGSREARMRALSQAPSRGRPALERASERRVERWAEAGRRVAHRLDALCARVTLLGEPDYPAPLLEVERRAPPVLSVRGALPELSSVRALAVVGTRRASDLGLRMCRASVDAICAAGWGVISGGAHGVDAAAHEEALRRGAFTGVVVGTGLDRCYPHDHASLFDRIVEAGGAIVSQFPPDTPGRPGHFPRRNAVIAGLARATLVVEAPRRSGTLHTAQAAKRAGRPVWALPGPAFDPGFAGAHALIASGDARLVHDLGEALASLEVEGTPRALLFPEEPMSSRAPEPGELSPIEAEIWAALSGEARSRDALVHVVGERGAVASALLSLELAGWIERVSGERFRRA